MAPQVQGRRKTTRRFQQLQQVLEMELRDATVWRVRRTQVQAYSLGTDTAGQAAGLTTQLIEM